MPTVQHINKLFNKFLIALPVIENSIFDRSVTLICQHNESGTMGLLLNKASKFTLLDMLSNLGIEVTSNKYIHEPLYDGGPVGSERGFVLHSPVGNWQSTIKITDDIGMTTSKDILKAIASGDAPKKFLIALGCSGWAQGQLEQEFLRNSWLSAPANNEIMFDTQIQHKWQKSAKLIGIDLLKMGQSMGNA